MPRVTSDLPLQPIPLNATWSHLSGLSLPDPDFGRPGRIDILLGVNVYIDVVKHGRWTGPPNSPAAFETKFGWVLAGRTKVPASSHQVTSYHVSVASEDVILSKFWERAECPKDSTSYSREERLVVEHFAENHRRSSTGRFVVPLPRKPQAQDHW